VGVKWERIRANPGGRCEMMDATEARPADVAVESTNIPAANTAMAAIGIAAAIICVAWLGAAAKTPLVLGSFGSSCVLLFAYPRSPFCRPRNFIGGHMVSSAVGLACLHLGGPEYWMMGVAVAASFVAMHFTGTIHPPAGGNPVIAFSTNADWSFLWFPTLAGTLIVQAVVFVHLWLLKKSEPRLQKGKPSCREPWRTRLTE